LAWRRTGAVGRDAGDHTAAVKLSCGEELVDGVGQVGGKHAENVARFITALNPTQAEVSALCQRCSSSESAKRTPCPIRRCRVRCAARPAPSRRRSGVGLPTVWPRTGFVGCMAEHEVWCALTCQLHPHHTTQRHTCAPKRVACVSVPSGVAGWGSACVRKTDGVLGRRTVLFGGWNGGGGRKIEAWWSQRSQHIACVPYSWPSGRISARSR